MSNLKDGTAFAASASRAAGGDFDLGGGEGEAEDRFRLLEGVGDAAVAIDGRTRGKA